MRELGCNYCMPNGEAYPEPGFMDTGNNGSVVACRSATQNTTARVRFASVSTTPPYGSVGGQAA